MRPTDVEARIARLEALHRPRQGGVLVQREGETIEGAVARARAAGRGDDYLVLPARPADPAAWAAQVAARQATIAARTAAWLAAGDKTGTYSLALP